MSSLLVSLSCIQAMEPTPRNALVTTSRQCSGKSGCKIVTLSLLSLTGLGLTISSLIQLDQDGHTKHATWEPFGLVGGLATFATFSGATVQEICKILREQVLRTHSREESSGRDLTRILS